MTTLVDNHPGALVHNDPGDGVSPPESGAELTKRPWRNDPPEGLRPGFYWIQYHAVEDWLISWLGEDGTWWGPGDREPKTTEDAQIIMIGPRIGAPLVFPPEEIIWQQWGDSTGFLDQMEDAHVQRFRAELARDEEAEL